MTNNENENQAMPVDLDALEELLANATEWEKGGASDIGDIIRRDIANAVPALIAEVRELRELTTPEPISEKHYNGDWWLIWDADSMTWMEAIYCEKTKKWYCFGYELVMPTSALSMPWTAGGA